MKNLRDLRVLRGELSFSGLLRITYLRVRISVGRATPDAAGKARPTVNHLTVMNYVKLNKRNYYSPRPLNASISPRLSSCLSKSRRKRLW